MLVAALGHERLVRAAGIADRLRRRTGAWVFPRQARVSDRAGLVCHGGCGRAGGRPCARGRSLPVALAGRGCPFSGRQSSHDPAGPGDDSPIRLRGAAVAFEKLDHLRARIRWTTGDTRPGLSWNPIVGHTGMEYRHGGTTGSLSTAPVAYVDRLPDFKRTCLKKLCTWQESKTSGAKARLIRHGLRPD